MKKTNEVSKLVGVSRRTLQYYDNEGLLDVKRSKNNYRFSERFVYSLEGIGLSNAFVDKYK